MTFAALAPFRVRSYRFQWPADLMTSWALEMESLILGWYVLVETGSVVMLTIFGSLYYIGTLIAPMVGVTSDRIGHCSLLSAMRAGYAAVAATLMVLAFAGALTPIIVCACAAATGLGRSSDMGLRGALIADTMPPLQLTGAMGISRTTGDTARIAGALTGAGLFATFGIGPAYVAITVFYVLAAILTWCTGLVRTPEHATVTVVPGTSPWRDLREGFVHIWETPSLLALVWLAFLYNLTAFSLTQGLMPYVARDIYHIDQTGLGYLVASLATGALIGAISISWFGIGVHLARVMIVFGLIWHALLLIFAQMQSMPGGIVLLLLVGVAQSLTMVCHAVILLRATAPRFRGRVLGVRMLAIYSLPLGLLAAGALIGQIGYHATVSLYAVTGFVFTAVIALRWRQHLWNK
jgi:MFS family permease